MSGHTQDLKTIFWRDRLGIAVPEHTQDLEVEFIKQELIRIRERYDVPD